MWTEMSVLRQIKRKESKYEIEYAQKSEIKVLFSFFFFSGSKERDWSWDSNTNLKKWLDLKA